MSVPCLINWEPRLLECKSPSFGGTTNLKSYYLFQIQEDQLMWHGGFRARHTYILLQGCDYAINNLPNITIPVLVLQGTEVIF
jgi:hypothetical protein